MRNKGFTLIEILIVISIITILSGMMVMGVSYIKQTARKEATRALIRRISIALNEYQLAYFAYPPSDGQYTGSQNLYYYLGEPLELTQGYNPATGEMLKQTFGPAMAGGFKKSDYNDQKYIIDSWETPFTYENPGKDHSPSGNNNSSFVDIESAGPNRKFDLDSDSKNDDISNWKQEKYLTK